MDKFPFLPLLRSEAFVLYEISEEGEVKALGQQDLPLMRVLEWSPSVLTKAFQTNEPTCGFFANLPREPDDGTEGTLR